MGQFLGFLGVLMMLLFVVGICVWFPLLRFLVIGWVLYRVSDYL